MLQGQVRRMNVSDAQRPKALEAENSKLKRLLANSMLEVAATREVLKGNSGRGGTKRRRAAVAGVGLERAPGTEADMHEPQHPALPPLRRRQLALRERLRELAGQHRRHGYRMLYNRLRIDGWAVNVKRTYSVYRGEDQMVRKRWRKRLPAAEPAARAPDATQRSAENGLRVR